jgi:outer membrane protein OmpA-like peptidoglycan-associated protein
MDRQIGVQIEGEKYIRLVNIDRERRGELKFTTIQDEQRRAVIKVFLFEDERMLPLKEIEVGGIPPEKAGVPEINLSTEYDGNKTLVFHVTLNGSSRARESVEIKRRHAVTWKGLVIIPVAIAVFVSLFFVVKNSVYFDSQSAPKATDNKVFSEAPARKERQLTTDAKSVNTKTAREDKTASAHEKKEITSSSSISDKSSAEEKSVKSAVVLEEKVKTERNYEASEKNTALFEVKKDTALFTVKEPAFDTEAGTDRTAAGGPVTGGSLPATVYFSPGRAALTDEALAKLDEILPILMKNQDKKVIITGHCALYSNEEARRQLSSMRSKNVYWYLRDNGWKPGKKPDVSGQGGLQPISRDPEYQHLNRRVEISILE